MRKKRDLRDILYVGLDESNHGRYPEICVAVFSWDADDSIPLLSISDRNRKDAWEKLNHGIKEGVRDYRFAILSKNIMQRGNQLPYVASELIIPYIAENPCEKIEILIDGEVSDNEEQFIRYILKANHSGKIVIKNFVKQKEKGKRKKRQRLPLVLKLADEISHDLFRNFSLEKLTTQFADKRIILS